MCPSSLDRARYRVQRVAVRRLAVFRSHPVDRSVGLGLGLASLIEPTRTLEREVGMPNSSRVYALRSAAFDSPKESRKGKGVSQTLPVQVRRHGLGPSENIRPWRNPSILHCCSNGPSGPRIEVLTEPSMERTETIRLEGVWVL